MPDASDIVANATYAHPDLGRGRVQAVDGGVVRFAPDERTGLVTVDPDALEPAPATIAVPPTATDSAGVFD